MRQGNLPHPQRLKELLKLWHKVNFGFFEESKLIHSFSELPTPSIRLYIRSTWPSKFTSSVTGSYWLSSSCWRNCFTSVWSNSSCLLVRHYQTSLFPWVFWFRFFLVCYWLWITIVQTIVFCYSAVYSLTVIFTWLYTAKLSFANKVNTLWTQLIHCVQQHHS